MKVTKIRNIELTQTGVKAVFELDANIAKLEDLARRVNDSRPEDSWTLAVQKTGPERSVLANAYYWVLIGKLAQALHTSTKELHQKIISDYGIVKTDEGGYPITFVLAADANPNKVCPYTRVVGRSMIDGTPCVQYAVLKGSSEMDSYEFSTLLDGLIYECEETGVDIVFDIGNEKDKVNR